jgi:hypothetical protein
MLCVERDRLVKEVRQTSVAVHNANNLKLLLQASEAEHVAVEALANHMHTHRCEQAAANN